MDFTLLFIYFITVNKYRFCISVIGYINIQIIGIGYKKINIGRSLLTAKANRSANVPLTLTAKPNPAQITRSHYKHLNIKTFYL